MSAGRPDRWSCLELSCLDRTPHTPAHTSAPAPAHTPAEGEMDR